MKNRRHPPSLVSASVGANENTLGQQNSRCAAIGYGGMFAPGSVAGGTLGFPAGLHRAWAQIDLSALERNVKKIRAALPAEVKYIAVVKGDAYGHGYRQTAARLMQNGVDAFAVANLREAEALREMGGGWPIMVLSPILPGEAEGVFELGVVPALSSQEEVETFEKLAARRKRLLPVQLKVDTGMGRAGVWHAEAAKLARRVEASKSLRLEGVMTHFASADADEDFTRLQRERFEKIVRGLAQKPALVHADASSGFERYLKAGTVFNAVRIGRLQFGLPNFRDPKRTPVEVEPILSFHARVALIKELPKGATVSYSRTRKLTRKSRIAVVAAGYADGVPTHVSDRGEMLLHGRRAPILGRVTMDMTMLDATDIPGVCVGDVATIIGRDGGEVITLTEVAATAQSVAWEVLTSITQRAPRLYQKGLGV